MHLMYQKDQFWEHCYFYYYDLPSVVQHSNIKLFADDVAIYNEANCSEDCDYLRDEFFYGLWVKFAKKK